MTLFLRTKNNKTIFEVSINLRFNDNGMMYYDLSSDIDIETYSFFLLENINKSGDIISDFDELNNIRAWLWEMFYSSHNHFFSKDETKELFEIKNKIAENIRQNLSRIVKKYNLIIVED
jgi:hypothetical protein